MCLQAQKETTEVAKAKNDTDAEQAEGEMKPLEVLMRTLILMAEIEGRTQFKIMTDYSFQIWQRKLTLN